MLSVEQKEILRDRAYDLLWGEGMKVESEALTNALLGAWV